MENFEASDWNMAHILKNLTAINKRMALSATKNIMKMDSAEAKSFFQSFDKIVTDCDGVLWRDNPLPGIEETIKNLKKSGKEVYYLTNNTSQNFEGFRKKFSTMGVDLKQSDILFPMMTIVNYLKSQNFNKKILCVAMSKMIKGLQEAGFECVVMPNELPEDVPTFLNHLKEDPDIGAVLVDFDPNFNYVKLCKIVSVLKKSDIIYIAGATDNSIPISSKDVTLGPGIYQSLIAKLSNKEPLVMGKASQLLVPFVLEKFGIKDPKRTIFIGDTLENDMEFAHLCGFQKLIVLSGITSIQQINDSEGETFAPNYIAENFSDFNEFIKKHQLL